MAEQIDKQEDVTGFMQRWSRRKIDAESEAIKELEQEKKSANIVPTGPKAEEYKTDADMPPIEQLTEESDFSDFLSPKVSEALRKQALRKLFHMPSMNIVDGLDDYAEDFTSFSPLGDIIPHEMKRMLDREKAKEEEPAAAQEEQAPNNTNADDLESEELDTAIDHDDEDIQQPQLSADNPEQQEIIQEQELINHKDKIENEKLN